MNRRDFAAAHDRYLDPPDDDDFDPDEEDFDPDEEDLQEEKPKYCYKHHRKFHPDDEYCPQCWRDIDNYDWQQRGG